MATGLIVSLRVRDSAKAIEFYQRAFGAKELYRLLEPSGRVGHAEIDLDGNVIAVSDEYPEYQTVGPQTLGGCSAIVDLQVDDVETLFRRAVEAGAKVIFPLSNQFYGHRSGRIEDPFGHQWILSQEIEKVSPEEMQRRLTAMFG